MSAHTEILNDFERISLHDLDRAALQNRFENKYLFSESLLPVLLSELQPDYQALNIDDCQEFDYLTWYFDTPDFHLYRDHHNGYVHRMKIRQRRYEQSGMTYFEVKRREGELRTDKIRLRIPGLQPVLPEQLLAVIPGQRLDVSTLQYKLSNRFRRITLCSKNGTGRVTLDRNISMQNEALEYKPGQVMLMEIKQQRPDSQSPAFRLMKKLHIFESGFSKYAVAAAKLYPELKKNNLKPVFLKLEQYAGY